MVDKVTYIKELQKQFKTFTIEEKQTVNNWNGREYKCYTYIFNKNGKYQFKYEFQTKKSIKQLESWYIKDYTELV